MSKEAFSLSYKGDNLKGLLCNLLKCNQNPVRFWTITEGQDEPIPQGKMQLSKPIKPGFRRPITITPDEAVDKMSDGKYASTEITVGDSTVTYNDASTPTSIKLWINGDGALGDKECVVSCDGHIGDGEVAVTVTIGWVVATPDATLLTVSEGTTDEPIPVP